MAIDDKNAVDQDIRVIIGGRDFNGPALWPVNVKCSVNQLAVSAHFKAAKAMIKAINDTAEFNGWEMDNSDSLLDLADESIWRLFKNDTFNWYKAPSVIMPYATKD
jgi:hypothetical protein